MRGVRTALTVIALALACGPGAPAQGMKGGVGRQPPRLLGEFKPVVGTGAQYLMTSQNGSTHFSYVIVGKEDVGGSTGYWLEVRTQGGEIPGEIVMKQLMVMSAEKPEIKRMIVQQPGRPPMEFPLGMMPGLAQQGAESGDTTPGVKLGAETILIPAGSFECDHYRKQESRGPVDIWISSRVSPYGTVKMSRGDLSLVLEKVLTNEVSHIHGEPRPLNFPMQHPEP